MSRFVRSSRFRHVFGTGTKKESQYDNIKVSRSAWDSNIAVANSKFISVNLEAAGGGQFQIIPLEKVGKLAPDYPVFTGHSAAVIDTAFNPFNDHIVASAGEDGKVLIWHIPEGGPTDNQDSPSVTLNYHNRKCGHVLFHPTAKNVVLSTGADLLVKLYDIEKGTEKLNITAHTDLINSVTFNWEGNLIATTSKDKKLRIIDLRSGKVTQQADAHTGVKGARVLWLGEKNKLITTGFSKTSDRQLTLWDANDLSTPLKSENLDTSSGQLMSHYDPDLEMLYLAGKGDGNIRYYEITDEAPFIHSLAEFKTSEPQRGIAFAPKRSCDIMGCEIAKAYKVTVGAIEPVSFRVPRKADFFQQDLYPDTVSNVPAMTADEFFSGQTKKPNMCSLDPAKSSGGASSQPKAFTPQVSQQQQQQHNGSTMSRSTSQHSLTEIKRDPVQNPQNEKEYMDAFHALRKENEDLKKSLVSCETKMRSMEVKLSELGR